MYAEQVKELRDLDIKYKSSVPYEVLDALAEAADAIEELSVIVREQKAVIDKLTQQLRVETENGKV